MHHHAYSTALQPLYFTYITLHALHARMPVCCVWRIICLYSPDHGQRWLGAAWLGLEDFESVLWDLYLIAQFVEQCYTFGYFAAFVRLVFCVFLWFRAGLPGA